MPKRHGQPMLRSAVLAPLGWAWASGAVAGAWWAVPGAGCFLLTPGLFFFLRNGEIKQGAGHFFSVGRGLLLERGVKKGCLS